MTCTAGKQAVYMSARQHGSCKCPPLPAFDGRPWHLLGNVQDCSTCTHHTQVAACSALLALETSHKEVRYRTHVEQEHKCYLTAQRRWPSCAATLQEVVCRMPTCVRTGVCHVVSETVAIRVRQATYFLFESSLYSSMSTTAATTLGWLSGRRFWTLNSFSISFRM